MHGVSVNPVAFLVIQNNLVKLLPIDHSTSIDKILDYIPDLFEKVSNIANKSMQNKKEQTDKIISAFQRKCEKENTDNVEAKEKNDGEKREDSVIQEQNKEVKREIIIEE